MQRGRPSIARDELGLFGGEEVDVADALITATVRAAGATLYTSDRRARQAYDLLGIVLQLIA